MKPRIEDVEAILSERRIAVVGVSRTKGFGTYALRTLRERGWDALPVNAHADEIAGERCHRSLAELPEPPGAVLAVVPPAETERVVSECARLGIRKLWIQQGAESALALKRAEAAGMTVVAGACILMYAEPRGLHRLHRWLHDRRRTNGACARSTPAA
jgi:uncharacterized protein